MKSILAASFVSAAALGDFDAYKTKFGKTYATAADEQAAKECYEENVEIIAGHQAANSLATFGENKFTDQCAEAFRKERTLGDYMQQQNGICTKTPGPPPYEHDADLNKDVDWRTKGYVNAVKDQGRCGSCWAFSATASMEAAWFKKTGKLLSLSEQDVVSCDQTMSDLGCMGGGPDTAFYWNIGYGGMVLESAYPYTSGTSGVRGTCDDAGMDKVAHFSSYRYLPAFDELTLLAALQNTGPISITVNANPWQSYTGGIMTSGPTGSTDHAVLLVGYTKGSPSYWTVRNSWGTDWGENGYIRMVHNKNTCDIVHCMNSFVIAGDSATSV